MLGRKLTVVTGCCRPILLKNSDSGAAKILPKVVASK